MCALARAQELRSRAPNDAFAGGSDHQRFETDADIRRIEPKRVTRCFNFGFAQRDRRNLLKARKSPPRDKECRAGIETDDNRILRLCIACVNNDCRCLSSGPGALPRLSKFGCCRSNAGILRFCISLFLTFPTRTVPIGGILNQTVRFSNSGRDTCGSLIAAHVTLSRAMVIEPIVAEEIRENPCGSGDREGFGEFAPIRMTVRTRKNQRHPHE